MCEHNPDVSSHISNDIGLIILLILETILILALVIATIRLYNSKKSEEVVFPENEETVHSV